MPLLIKVVKLKVFMRKGSQVVTRALVASEVVALYNSQKKISKVFIKLTNYKNLNGMHVFPFNRSE